MPSPIITLTSDFGWRDGYVAAMKGVILGICPDAILVDISHELPAHDIAHAAFVLGSTFPHYPPRTVHVAVVDPGVGTARRPLLLTTPGGTYIAPDNGLISYVLMECGTIGWRDTASERGDSPFEAASVPVPGSCAAYVLNSEGYWLNPVSNTFHGRDIFAPVAAHLASGGLPRQLGEPGDEVQCIGIPWSVERENSCEIEGSVICIDRFGNLVSSIRLIESDPRSVEVEIQGRLIPGLSPAYAGAEELLAIIGSHGYLEIAVRGGSAAEYLGADVGTEVRVVHGGGAARPDGGHA